MQSEQTLSVVIDIILPYLNVKNLLKCSAVCKIWYSKINSDNLLWKTICRHEEITSEQWDWNDNEESYNWILEKPCKWKQYFINCKKTTYNLKNNKYRQYKFEANNLKQEIEYNSKILTISHGNGTNIFKIVNYNFELLQILPIKHVKINEDYLIGLDNKDILIIYEFMNERYEFNYMVYAEDKVNWDLIVEFDGTKQSVLPCNQHFIIENIFKSVIILKEYHKLRWPLIWDIQAKKIITSFPRYNYLDKDQFYFYLQSTFRNDISAFNEKCEQIYKIDVKLSALYHIFDSYETVYCWWWKNNIKNKCFLSKWNKLTGIRITNEKELNVNPFTILKIIHPTSDIFILLTNIESDNLSNFYRLTGYNFDTHCKLWQVINHERLFYLLSAQLHYYYEHAIVIEKRCTMERVVLKLFNVNNGDLITSIDYNDKRNLSFIYHDMIVVFSKSNRVIMYLYR